jgi:hypothetical protein
VTFERGLNVIEIKKNIKIAIDGSDVESLQQIAEWARIHTCTDKNTRQTIGQDRVAGSAIELMQQILDA